MSNNPVVTFKHNLSALIEKKELALPSNVSPDAFRNAAVVAVQDNPQILACEESSIYKSIRTLAAAGLVPDGREAALVPFNTRQNGQYIKKCQAMPMVFGLIKMVRRSGEVQDIRAHIVYQKEVDQGLFSYVVGDEEKLEHKPILFGDRGEPVAAYAIARLKDGGIVREFMSAEEIDTVRRSSSAQKVKKGDRYAASDDPIGIWKDWWAEMWRKTVIRRLCKRLDMSSEDMRRVMTEQDQEPMRDITPREKPLTPLQQKVMGARGDLPEDPQGQEQNDDPIEGEIVGDDEGQSDAPSHWTDEVPYDGAFPGADEFTEGVKAAQAKKPITDCPYQDDEAKAVDWCGGWHEAHKNQGD